MRKIWIMVAALFGGCSDFVDTWDAYEIKAGHHYSTRTGMPRRLVSLKDGRHMRFDAYFTNSCLYDGTMGDDINKLYGFTDVNSLVHDNSVRFGWRHDGQGTIEIFAYWYTNGLRGFQTLGYTVPYQKDQYEIWARNGFYHFRFNDREYATIRKVDSENGLRVRLFPYFGGNRPAPNDMQIFIYEYN